MKTNKQKTIAATHVNITIIYIMSDITAEEKANSYYRKLFSSTFFLTLSTELCVAVSESSPNPLASIAILT